MAPSKKRRNISKIASSEQNAPVSEEPAPVSKEPLIVTSVPTLTRSSSVEGYVSESDRKLGNGRPRKKVFVARDSVLTVLSREDPNFRSLYHAFIVIVVTAIVYSLLKDSVEAGSPHADFGMLISGFGPPQQSLNAFFLWLPLQSAALLVYPAFKFWQWTHPRLGRVADSVAITLALLYNILAHCAVVISIVNVDLSPIPALVLALEQLRFSLKSYSFIRENAEKVLHPWRKDDEEGPPLWYQGQMEPAVGSFSKYLYFLFAPTLVYRDYYPRIERVCKLRVLAHFVKCCVSLAFISIIVKEVFGASFPHNWQLLAKTFLSCMLWGLVLQFMSGYFFLHSWNNLFGELLRFADRQFYSDWWTSNSFSEFYRKWNLLVHDWIKAYIYQDLKNLFKSRLFSKIAFLPAIIMSAVYHEYVLWAPLRFVMPVLVFQYCTFGIVFFAIKPSSSSWNYLVHIGLQIGMSIMVFCYAMEFYARKICPKEENAVNTFVPRFYECFLQH